MEPITWKGDTEWIYKSFKKKDFDKCSGGRFINIIKLYHYFPHLA